MTEIAFGPYEPDIASIGTTKSSYVKNVYPRSDGYAPVESLALQTLGLPSQCLGYFSAIATDGTTSTFAGTATGLYKLDNTTLGWTNVSLAAYNVGDRDLWSFVQFGNTVIAVTSNENPQAYNLISSTNFANLAGSPPKARSVIVVGDFVVLLSLTTAPAKIEWSGINDPTWWTVGQRNCDTQEFPDGGFVRGGAGGEFGIILQDTAIRRMIFAPGSSYIFQFDRISDERGLAQPYSLARAHGGIFFLSSDGFYRTDQQGALTNIGKARVNNTVLADADLTNPRYMIAAADPLNTRILWAYKSKSNSALTFDKIIAYDWQLDRWSPVEMKLAFIGTAYPRSVTLESLDTIAGANIDLLTTSFDAYESVPDKRLSGVSTDGRAGQFNGPSLEAILDTPEGTLGNGVRMFVRDVALVSDAGPASTLSPVGWGYGTWGGSFIWGAVGTPIVDGPHVSVISRDQLNQTPRVSAESLVGVRGYAPQRASGRYHTVRLRIGVGTSWTWARAIDADAKVEGKR